MSSPHDEPTDSSRRATATPPFGSIAIAGLGLIGGSIALAVRQQWPGAYLIALDDKDILDRALENGTIDAAAESVSALAGADLVVLAAPVRQNLEILRDMAARVPSPLLVTDVGGTKRAIVDAAAALSPALTFVGGHPLAGAAYGGLAFARTELFSDRPWIFTPRPEESPDTIAKLHCFAKGLGALPMSMTAAEHDHLMAYLSHLPQLTASALMATVGDAVANRGLALGGQGLVDTTRLASSPASVWQDICATNADVLGAALDLLIDRLSTLRADLQRGDAVAEVFDRAARWREELMKGGT